MLPLIFSEYFRQHFKLEFIYIQIFFFFFNLPNDALEQLPLMSLQFEGISSYSETNAQKTSWGRSIQIINENN